MKRFMLYIVLCISICACGQEDYVNKGGGWDVPQDSVANGIKIMSYNIKHCEPYNPEGNPQPANVKNIANVINFANPDLVFLQEVDRFTTRSGKDSDQIAELSELTGLKAYYFAKAQDYQGGEFGLAILSKYVLTNTRTLELPRKEIPGAYVGYSVLCLADVSIDGKKLTIGSVHLGLQQEIRNMQIPFMQEYFKNVTNPILVCGDFNATPSNSTIKTWDSYGFVRSNTDPKNFTIPSVPEPNRELDFITFRPAENFSVVSHKVFTGINASDHLPIMATIKIL